MFVRADSIKSLCRHSGGAFEQAANCKLFENLNKLQGSIFCESEDGDGAQFFCDQELVQFVQCAVFIVTRCSKCVQSI